MVLEVNYCFSPSDRVGEFVQNVTVGTCTLLGASSNFNIGDEASGPNLSQYGQFFNPVDGHTTAEHYRVECRWEFVSFVGSFGDYHRQVFPWGDSGFVHYLVGWYFKLYLCSRDRSRWRACCRCGVFRAVVLYFLSDGSERGASFARFFDLWFVLSCRWPLSLSHVGGRVGCRGDGALLIRYRYVSCGSGFFFV